MKRAIFYADIITDSNRAHEVIRRIRELAKKTDIQKVPLHINGVIEEVLLIFRHEALSHGVSLRQQLASSLPPCLVIGFSYNKS